MPIIDLGSVVGPVGPQGDPGPQGAQGDRGDAGPSTISTATVTNLVGALIGANGFVARKLIDSNPAANSENLITSGAVYARAGGIYSRTFNITGVNHFMRIPSLEEAVYLLFFERRSGTKEPYVAVVSYYLASPTEQNPEPRGEVTLYQLTTNALQLTASRTATQTAGETGLKIDMPTYCAGTVISNKSFELTFSAT